MCHSEQSDSQSDFSKDGLYITTFRISQLSRTIAGNRTSGIPQIFPGKITKAG
jgi:hypothetical protein